MSRKSFRNLVSLVMLVVLYHVYHVLVWIVSPRQPFTGGSIRGFGREALPVAVSWRGSHWFQCPTSSEFIPVESINDDYCDCKDGSDEPGTFVF